MFAVAGSPRRFRRTPVTPWRNPKQATCADTAGEARDRQTVDGNAGCADDRRRYARQPPRRTMHASASPPRDGIEQGDASSREEKKFAQIGAIGLVRREIRRLSGKFFLGAVQAVRLGEGERRALAARSRANASPTMPKKKKRVLPMFFFRHMSFVRTARIHSRRVATATAAFRYRPSSPAGKKKLREGVDT